MIGDCPHGRDPRSCPTCAPELVERFKAIGEAFAIVSLLARCTHGTHLTIAGIVFCSSCGARRMQAGGWKPTELGKRAIALAGRADLSSPWKSTA